MYIGDFALGVTFDTKFTTVASTGAPTALVGGAVAAYVGNSTTEIVAGITLTADFDTRTGLNNVRVVATGGNGYATASNYQLVITAGTVGGVSVVGYVVAEFSIENRSAALATALAVAQADLDNIQTRLPAALTVAGNMKTDTLYMMGRVWVDTNAGVPGTTLYVNGTLTNPVNTMPDARTIANATFLTAFQIRNRSGIVLDQNYGSFSFFGERWGLDLAGFAVANSYFTGADVSGISTGTNVRFDDCVIGTVTVQNGVRFKRCGLSGTVTVGAAGSFNFEQCFSATAAAVDAIIDFGAFGASTVACRLYNGGIEVRNMNAGDIFTITGGGRVTIAASCIGGSVGIGGNFIFVNNGTGQFIDDTARWNEEQNVANVTGSVGSVGAGGITAASIATGAIDADALAPDAVAEIWDEAVDGAVTARQSLRLANSANGAKLAGAASATVTIRDLADTKDRVTATVDGVGNRTAVVRDLT